MDNFFQDIKTETIIFLLAEVDNMDDNKICLKNQIKNLKSQIKEIDNHNPKYIEHILMKDRLNGIINNIEKMILGIEQKQIELKSIIPLKYRIKNFFKKLFKIK